MAKFSREQALRERRARKQEKKDERKNAALVPEGGAEDPTEAPADEGETPAA